MVSYFSQDQGCERRPRSHEKIHVLVLQGLAGRLNSRENGFHLPKLYMTMPITGRRRPPTYCSLPIPPNIHPLSAASLDCWWGPEGAIGWRAVPPGDRCWRGRAAKLAAAAATDYDIFLYHLVVCLYFALLIDASTMQPVHMCDRLSFFIHESVPLIQEMGTCSPKCIFFNGTDNFWLLIILWRFNHPTRPIRHYKNKKLVMDNFYRNTGKFQPCKPWNPSNSSCANHKICPIISSHKNTA
jgi:hypothetical protein